jgi:hypothetical protein
MRRSQVLLRGSVLAGAAACTLPGLLAAGASAHSRVGQKPPIKVQTARRVFARAGYRLVPNAALHLPRGQLSGDVVEIRGRDNSIPPAYLIVYANAYWALRDLNAPKQYFSADTYRVANVVLTIDLNVKRADKRRFLATFRKLGTPKLVS